MVKEAKSDASLRELALAAGLDEKELARRPLRGLWKGITITEKDIADAKRELFGDSFSE
jgi:hypothetical protein